MDILEVERIRSTVAAALNLRRDVDRGEAGSAGEEAEAQPRLNQRNRAGESCWQRPQAGSESNASNGGGHVWKYQ